MLDSHRKSDNPVHLITYPDSLGKDLSDLRRILQNHFEGCFGGIHILPFFPSTADRGFSPTTQLEVDSRFGSWEDIRLLAQKYELTADVIVNHISSQSKYFQDCLKNGRKSPYLDWFITPEKFSRRLFVLRRNTPFWLNLIEKAVNTLRRADRFFHRDGVNKFILQKIHRPRPGSPFVTFTSDDGKKLRVWCTFSRDQIDLDLNNPQVIKLLNKTLRCLSENGIRIVRLDAVGYAVKKRGTESFMIPKTYHLISKIAEMAHRQGLKVLPEVHGHYTTQIKLSQTPGVDFVYDFQLPILVLHTLFAADTTALKKWIEIRPRNIISTLDTHDGLPIPDVADLLTAKQIEAVVEQIHRNGGNDTLRASGKNSDNVDIYQINCTYYSALGENDDAYIAARAIQLFLPGKVQIYYVGLLAGRNDVQLLEKTGVGRDINRHFYSPEEIISELKRPVVRRLLKLIRLRVEHPAFAGKFKALSGRKKNILRLRWDNADKYCELILDCAKFQAAARYTDSSGRERDVVL